MMYKKKAIVLGAVVFALGLAYALTWIFDPQRTVARNAAFAWIEKDLLFQADRINISGAQGAVEMRRKKDIWVIEEGTKDLPVKQPRVDDFLGGLSRRGVYPVRASSAQAAGRLGLSDDSVSRLVIRGGAGLPLLDLLVGRGDATGREIYLRKAGRDEVRSGEDRFTQYLDSPRASWYDLRLFPDNERPETPPVQRVRVSPFDGRGGYSVSRSDALWFLEGASGPLDSDTQKVESWIRSILDAEGEDFNPALSGDNAELNEGTITLELGDGGVTTLRLGPPDAEGRRDAAVFSSSAPAERKLVYRLAAWTINRLFREKEYFGKG
jgi:hypothetical protein